MTKQVPFHAAISVHALDAARHFYVDLLGCCEGRSADTWIDFDFFGHQLSCHTGTGRSGPSLHNTVDCDDVPVPHIGVVLSFDEWESLAGRLKGHTEFLIGPRIRFSGRPGEQGTFFIADPSGNVLEFKGFRDRDRLFAPQDSGDAAV